MKKKKKRLTKLVNLGKLHQLQINTKWFSHKPKLRWIFAKNTKYSEILKQSWTIAGKIRVILENSKKLLKNYPRYLQ